MQTKRCTNCLADKSIDDFCKDSRAKAGRKSQCRVCLAEKAKIYNGAHREQCRASTKAWIAANSEKRRATRLANAKNNREKERARHKAWRIANPEKYKERCKVSYAKHAESRKECNRSWYAENLALQRERHSIWASKNRGKRTASLAKYRAAMLERTPKWLTEKDFQTMTFIYEMARALQMATGVKHHVDHELPLQGDLVSGLHVPLNLQILTAEENVKKKNHWSPEC